MARDAALEDTLEAIKQNGGGKATVVVADFADPAAVEAAASSWRGRGGSTSWSTTPAPSGVPRQRDHHADWQHVIDVNLNSTWAVTRPIGAAMVERGDGAVITIASLLRASRAGSPFRPTLRRQARVAGLTRALANEWAPAGIRVNAIAPDTSAPTTPPTCARTPVAAPSGNASPPVAGDSRTRWSAPRSSWPRRRRATSTATSSRSTAAGWPDRHFARERWQDDRHEFALGHRQDADGARRRPRTLAVHRRRQRDRSGQVDRAPDHGVAGRARVRRPGRGRFVPPGPKAFASPVMRSPTSTSPPSPARCSPTWSPRLAAPCTSVS